MALVFSSHLFAQDASSDASATAADPSTVDQSADTPAQPDPYSLPSDPVVSGASQIPPTVSATDPASGAEETQPAALQQTTISAAVSLQADQAAASGQ